jgi:hypothetical protein
MGFAHTGSGFVSVIGSVETKPESSLSAQGIFESGFSSKWRVGDGEYYWYRVEGSCGESRCDTTGIVYDTCNKMTFVTVVGARNIAELCYKLSNPTINPKIDFRVSSIQKYSRPIERSSSDDCNTLDDQEFCNIAECLEYCIDQDVTENFSFSMRAIESSFFAEMNGGFILYGHFQTDRSRSYEPELPLIGISGGASQFGFGLNPKVGTGTVSISSSAEINSSFYAFNSSGRALKIDGFARTVSPSRRYSVNQGSVGLSITSALVYSPNTSLEIDVTGAAVIRLLGRFVPSGGIGLSGKLVNYKARTFRYQGSGGVDFSGATSFNFDERGTQIENFSFDMSVFDLGSDSFLLNSVSELTISDQTISPSCGCGPLSLSLTLRHNMSNSSYLTSFLRRSGLSMGDSVPLRHKSSDSSWRHTQNFSGVGKDGRSKEDLSLLYSMVCSEGFWIFSFSAVNLNRSIGKELHTKFIIDIPSDLICSDGSIATVISLDIQNGGFREIQGNSFSAITPAPFLGRNPQPKSVSVYVDGIFNDKRIYYDEIGLFKNSYWDSKMLEMKINTPPGTKMPELELDRIFS